MVFKDMVITAASKRLALKIIDARKKVLPRFTVGVCLPVILVVRSP